MVRARYILLAIHCFIAGFFTCACAVTLLEGADFIIWSSMLLCSLLNMRDAYAMHTYLVKEGKNSE